MRNRSSDDNLSVRYISLQNELIALGFEEDVHLLRSDDSAATLKNMAKYIMQQFKLHATNHSKPVTAFRRSDVWLCLQRL